MRQLKWGDFNLNNPLNGVNGGTVALLPGEGYLIVVDKKRMNSDEGPIIVAVAGSNSELLREKAKYERNKRYKVFYQPDTTEEEKTALDSLDELLYKAPQQLCDAMNRISGYGVQLPHGDTYEEAFKWTENMRPYIDCDDMTFGNVSATYLAPAVLAWKAGEVNQYALTDDLSTLSFRKNEMPISINLFKCFDRDIMVGWTRDWKPIICYVHIDPDYLKNRVQISAISYTDYSEETEDFKMTPFSMFVKNGQTVNEVYESSFAELSSLSHLFEKVGIDKDEFIGFMRKSISIRNDKEILNDLIHALYLIIDNNIEPVGSFVMEKGRKNN